MAVFIKVAMRDNVTYNYRISIRRVSFKSFVTLFKLRGRCHARASNSQYSMKKRFI